MITLVTITAFNLRMSPFQLVSRLFMIKIIPPIFPKDQIKVTSMMLHMAGGALFKRPAPVQPLALFNLPF